MGIVLSPYLGAPVQRGIQGLARHHHREAMGSAARQKHG